MPEIANIRYTHEAIIDEILINPSISQGELSQRFGFTQSWMSIIINSDSFQERLAERKGELIDPAIKASIEDRLDAIAKRSLDKIMSRLDMDYPMKTTELVDVAKLGVGNRNQKPVGPQVQNNLYVMNIPAPAKSAEEWLSSSRRPPGMVIEG